MRKILIGLSAGTAMLLGTVSSFAADGLGIGVTLSGVRLSTTGSEVEGGETNRKGVQNSFALGSVFADFTFLNNWVTIGYSIVPGEADVSDAQHQRTDVELSVTDTTTHTTTSRTQQASATVSDHNMAYIEIGNAYYLKAGYVEVSVETNESLGTGSAYGNTTLEGTLLGAGYKSDWGDNGFIKLEGTYTDYDPLALTSSTARTDVTTNNKISADIDSTAINLGIGYKF